MTKGEGFSKRFSGLIIAAVIIILGVFLPVPNGVTRQGVLSVCFFISTIVLWLCKTFPMMIVSLLIIFLLPLFKVITLNDIFTSFGSMAFFFAVPVFVLTKAIENTSLPLRICYTLIRRTKGSSTALVFSVMLACTLTSALVSNLSSCIIYLSLALSLLEANNCRPGQSNLGRCLMIGIPAMAGCGGVITPAGTPGNVIIIDLLASRGISISFLQWIAVFAPLSLLCCIVSGLSLTALFKPEKITEDAIKALESRVKECGALKGREKKTLVIISSVLFLWILGTWVPALNITVVAMIGMAVLFLPGVDVLDWNTVESKVNWDLVFTIGSVNVLISALNQTGIVDWLVSGVLANLGPTSSFMVLFIVSIVACIIRAFIPTSPVFVGLLAPLLLPLAALTGLSPTALMVILAFWAGTSFLLYIQPLFLFSFGHGYYAPGELLKWGWFPSLIMCMLLSFMPFYLRIFGL